MRRPGLLLIALSLVAIVVWWPLLLGPVARGGVVLVSVYSSALSGSNAVAAVTPEPRVSESSVDLAGVRSRVTWFAPGAGERHPAMLIVNGATPLGNDDAETRRICDALARAGYLVMLPELGFLKEARLERAAPAQVDAAFAAMLQRGDADPDRSGAFGFSVGGGILFAAAGRSDSALAGARYLGALGAYFDIDTYLASVVTGTQRRHGALEPWQPDPEARLKLPLGAAMALADEADRRAVGDAIRSSGGPLAVEVPATLGPEARALWAALAETDYDRALARLAALPTGLRDTFSTLSPRTRWADVRAPVYWLHDEGDRFEPVSEAETAATVRRPAATRLQLTRLLSHAAALGPEARQQGADFWIRELAGLFGFAVEVLRSAG